MIGSLGVQGQQLVYSAQQAMQSGRLDEAARLWAQVLATAPEHSQALFHLGQHKLMQKDIASALSLLERAARADPNAPAIALNIAFAHRAAGNTAAELAALDRALAIDPYFLPALLSKGAALERGGLSKQAAQIYRNALSVAPADHLLSPELRTSLAHAGAAVAQNAEHLDRHLGAKLAALRARYADLSLDRFEECKEVILGRKKVYVQQPSMLHFPRLPAIQFYDRAEFAWLPLLEAATNDIRQEFLAIYGEDNRDFVPYVNHPEGAPTQQWTELNRSPRWSVYFLWKDGQKLNTACHRCPKTAAAAETVPMIDIPNFAPTVMFSTLAPHTRIPPHSSVTNVRLVVHLPLIVPNGCGFRVGNDVREWREGKAWVFDDTMEHEAWNDSDRLRVILMIDIWNPYLNKAERELVSALLNGLREYNQDDRGWH